MDDTPLSKRPWFYIARWLVFLLVVYGWQIYRMGGIPILDIIVDGILFIVFLLLWLAFFAQFVLPVRTLGDRQKIFDRLITYLSGGHGPAIFIRNGELIKREGEERRNGPGVLWLDSASAAVTRTATKFKQTMGPGVHFIDNGEFIAGTVDLHIQSQTVGPKESDQPFAELGANQDPDEWKQVQDRRKQVSALTRDGIEVIPNISVSFRIRTGFPAEGQLGSRFGYRTGITPKDKRNEKQDCDAIYRAITGEGINPNVLSDSPRRRVAWNELPASLAVDVWREYVSKFTLDELFKPDQLIPPPVPQLPPPIEEEIDPLSQPLQIGPKRNTLQDNLTVMTRELNLQMARMIKWLEGDQEGKPKKPPLSQTLISETNQKQEPRKATALQVINDMVNARLKQAEVDFVDDQGRRGEGTLPSLEYKLLENRGLEVRGVSISSLRLNPEIDETIRKKWSAAWLSIANTEKGQIERKRNIMESTGQEKAMRQYADLLSSDLIRKRPVGPRETLKTLLMRTKTIIIQDDQLRKRMSDQQQQLDEIIRQIEANGL
ncbi:MAG TPA: hypothetical protein VN653_09420 [Anaerolineales bacterium]|nr:hypothetical protein [Anaerolineales bacterium]